MYAGYVSTTAQDRRRWDLMKRRAAQEAARKAAQPKGG